MVDFLKIGVKDMPRLQTSIIYPIFIVKRSSDLMIRGRDFYAIYDEETKLWSTSEDTVTRIIDAELDRYVQEHGKKLYPNVQIKYMWDSSSGSIDSWHKYVQKQMRDNYVQLDSKIIFKSTVVKKTDYATKRLPYDPAPGEMPNYIRFSTTVFDDPEREKLEWSIGAIACGDSKKIQKFVVMYGEMGSGKGTYLGFVVEPIFQGYCASFEAKSLSSKNNQFSMEAFNKGPLVGIDADGDLSNIADNTKLNMIVSHEKMLVNEKFKSQYEAKFYTFLFIGSNEPVKITGSKSGLNRRLIDVYPSGRKLTPSEYDKVTAGIQNELGAICDHCIKVYKSLGKNYYSHYEPKKMQEETDHFYDFIFDYYYDVVKDSDGVSMSKAWTDYKKYCEESNVSYPYQYTKFRSEIKNYFKKYEDRARLANGEQVRKWLSGFKKEKILENAKAVPEPIKDYIIEFKEGIKSVFDNVCATCLAQYATNYEKPGSAWANVKTKLSELDTRKLHYVRIPVNHIVIDFDLKDAEGNKSYELNLAEASKWPKTYAELSKSGAGIHLHYFYEGDPTILLRRYSENVEIKVFNGNSSLRRKLTKCNDVPIATIEPSLLPVKGGKNVLNKNAVKDEDHLRFRILKALKKEVWPNTTPNVNYIYSELEKAYESGMPYNVTNLKQTIYNFCSRSTNQSDHCLDLWRKMHFKSETEVEPIHDPKENEKPIIFYDVEVMKNLFVLCWKYEGLEHDVNVMINPTPDEVAKWMAMEARFVGFNDRKYDAHIVYARAHGYTNMDLYNLSQSIILNGTGFFGPAYSFPYTDVFDFCSEKQSLKKWEIALGEPHQELPIKWDQEVPEDMFDTVAKYCCNDVRATEAVWIARQEDYQARLLLAKFARKVTGKGEANNTTNQLTELLIFRGDKRPQSQFNCPDLSKMFPGYKCIGRKSYYRGEEFGEGGYVFAEMGMHEKVVTFDVASMHPSSIIAEQGFGPYTKNFEELVNIRLAIKHGEYDKIRGMYDGIFDEYLTDKKSAKALSFALKIVINSVYGKTWQKYKDDPLANPFYDPRNTDNWVAKRGELFMIDLKNAVQEKGYTVVHVKTDSIKVVNPDNYISEFIMDFGKKYGYTFEIEARYKKFCLITKADYIAQEIENKWQYSDGFDKAWICEKNELVWSPKGKRLSVPYVFKTLFSHEPIEFKDLCETKQVSTAIYLDMNEDLPENEHNYIFVGKIGLFCPIKKGCGGGELKCERNNSYNYVQETTGYRWLESEMVKRLHKEDDIDLSYYDVKVTDAINKISKFGDFERFVSDEEPDSYNFDEVAVDPVLKDVDAIAGNMNKPEDIPWD